nr:pyridoxal phosphate-dependent aminotransferase [Maliibacterium massiliense]
MISQKMLALGSKRSVIRELFEYGKKRAAQIGAQNIFDFSLGNPSVPAPPCVNQTLAQLLSTTDSVALHGYTSAQGDAVVRKTIADYVNKTHGTSISADNIYMTVGAAASVSISIQAIACPGDAFITFAPFFPEYRVFVEMAGATLVPVAPDPDTFQIDVDRFAAAITPRTKGVIINSPNNPSGVVYSQQTIDRICEVLRQKSAQYGAPIYLISDEPYRELVYEGVTVPYLLHDYDNTFICYSYSKSLSLPGERIGYIIVSDKMQDAQDVYFAVCGAGRALGYVCAPSLFQRLVAACVDQTADVSIYKKNRDLLYDNLCAYGFTCVKPDGAFYLFVKAMEPDANAFCARAKAHELLLVPGDDFGCPGYVRIAYCVQTELIERALPAFKKLAESYQK